MCYRDSFLDQFRIFCSQWSRKIQLKHENSSFSFHVIYRLTISFDFSLLDLLIRHSKFFFWFKSFLFFSFLTIFWFDMLINIFFCAHLSLLHRLMKKFQQFETRYLLVQLKVILYILIEFIANKIDKIFDVNWNAKLNDLFISSKFFFFFWTNRTFQNWWRSRDWFLNYSFYWFCFLCRSFKSLCWSSFHFETNHDRKSIFIKNLIFNRTQITHFIKSNQKKKHRDVIEFNRCIFITRSNYDENEW